MYKLFLSIWLPIRVKISTIMSILVIKSLAKGGFNRSERSKIRIAATEQMWPRSWLHKQIWGLGIILHYGLPMYRWWKDH